jgi:polysaccharide biosynthesis/export protein
MTAPHAQVVFAPSLLLHFGHPAGQSLITPPTQRKSGGLGPHFLFPITRRTNTVDLLQPRPVLTGRQGVFSMSILRRLAAALLVLPFLAALTSAQDYKVRAGDVLQIEVLEDATLNRTAIVLPDGQISLPLVGSIRAAGRSLADVQADLAGRLAPNFAAAPTVFVTLSALAERVVGPPPVPRVMDVYVLGAATTPGKVDVKPGATLLQALAQAGGVSPFAAKKRIQLRRVDKSGTEKVYKFDLDAIERGESGGGATQLMSGDVIVIPQRKLFE